MKEFTTKLRKGSTAVRNRKKFFCEYTSKDRHYWNHTDFVTTYKALLGSIKYVTNPMFEIGLKCSYLRPINKK
jgi:hypothetical protein